jgi:hypothetical protein
MKKAAKLTFACVLVLTAIAPSFSHAAYFVDQTKTWAIGDKAQDIMAKRSATRGVHAFAMVPRSGLTTYRDNAAATGAGSIGYNELLSHSNNY